MGYEREEIESQLLNLIHLIKLDGKVTEVEINFLKKLGIRKGFSENEIKSLWDRDVRFTPPKTEFQRIIMFHTFILMAYADHEIHEKEVQQCYQLGIMFGLNFLAVQNILLKLLHAPKMAIDAKYITDTFKLFNN